MLTAATIRTETSVADVLLEARVLSVTLINIFEVPAGDEEEFIAAWEKTRDYLMMLP